MEHKIVQSSGIAYPVRNRHKRAIDFRLETAKVNLFGYARNIYLTRLFNSLSLLFPEGEKFFANSIRYYEKDLPQNLVEEAKLFYKEGQHSREHRKLNNLLREAGFDTDSLEAAAKRKLMVIGNNPKRQLIVTVCLEIFTAYGADLLFAIENIVFNNNEGARLWKYHAREERGHGHRTIAHKVLDHVGGISKTTLAFYFILCTILLVVQTAENYAELSK